MKLKYQTINNLKIADNLLAFINEELLKDMQAAQEKVREGLRLHEGAAEHAKAAHDARAEEGEDGGGQEEGMIIS